MIKFSSLGFGLICRAIWARRFAPVCAHGGLRIRVVRERGLAEGEPCVAVATLWSQLEAAVVDLSATDSRTRCEIAAGTPPRALRDRQSQSPWGAM